MFYGEMCNISIEWAWNSRNFISFIRLSRNICQHFFQKELHFDRNERKNRRFFSFYHHLTEFRRDLRRNSRDLSKTREKCVTFRQHSWLHEAMIWTKRASNWSKRDKESKILVENKRISKIFDNNLEKKYRNLVISTWNSRNFISFWLILTKMKPFWSSFYERFMVQDHLFL